MARSVPAPPPFSYVRTGFAPATFRRGIPLRRLGRQLNPFPLVQLPYHRLVNPWTLEAVLHEVSHNLHSGLDLTRDVPRSIADRLLRAGCGRFVASVWTRWNREMFADMSALLLGGPGVLGTVMDVVGRGPETMLTFNPQGVHPMSWLTTYETGVFPRLGARRRSAARTCSHSLRATTASSLPTGGRYRPHGHICSVSQRLR